MNTRILPVWQGIKRKKCWEFKILRILKGSSFSCQQKGVVQGARCICDSQNSAFHGKRTAKYRAKSHEDVQVTLRIQPEGKNMWPLPSSWQSHVETWWMLAQSWTYVIYMYIYIYMTHLDMTLHLTVSSAVSKQQPHNFVDICQWPMAGPSKTPLKSFRSSVSTASWVHFTTPGLKALLCCCRCECSGPQIMGPI